MTEDRDKWRKYVQVGQPSDRGRLKKQNRKYSIILRHLICSVVQNLATFNKIVFTKGGISDKKCTKIVFVFGRGSASEPAGGALRRPSVVCIGGAIRRYSPLEKKKYLLLPIPLPLDVFGVLMSGPFFKYDHLATARDRSAKNRNIMVRLRTATARNSTSYSNATRNSRSGIPSFSYSVVYDVSTHIAQCALCS